MKTISKLTRRAALGAAALAGTLALVAALSAPEQASAEVPAGTPQFSDPLDVTHPYFPIVPGGVKVYGGRDEGRRVTVVENHLPEPREVIWNDQVVLCHVIKTLAFANGQLADTEQRFVAQADDGSVYTFGETEDGPSPDDDPSEGSGWIVGAVQPGDPSDVVAGAEPTLFLPADPELGDFWFQENVDQYQETAEVKRTTTTARTRAGRFRDSVRISVTDLSDGDTEAVWFAPGVGPVRFRGDGKRIRLSAATLLGK